MKSLGVGENHIILVTCTNNNNSDTQDIYVQGSNRFGQLGLPNFQSDNEMQKINIFVGNNIKPNIQSFHCGAEHTFFITGTHNKIQIKTKSTVWDWTLRDSLGMATLKI